MKLREVFKKVCNYLQLDETKTYLVDLTRFDNFEIDRPTLTNQVKAELNLLVECANNVCTHIATNYIPLYFKQSISIVDNKFDITKLNKTLFKIKKLTKNGFYKNYQIIDGNIVCDNGEYEILYSYYPVAMALEDDCLDFYGRVSLLAYCYGIASEYCLTRGDYEQAYFWDDKYKETLKNCKRRAKETKLPARRWF